MKQGIHPEYVDCVVKCSCGNTFTTRSTKPELKIDICNACHPFYTGTQKLIDTGGRVQRFADRFGAAKDVVAEREAAKKAERAAQIAEREAAKKAEREAKAAAKAERAPPPPPPPAPPRPRGAPPPPAPPAPEAAAKAERAAAYAAKAAEEAARAEAQADVDAMEDAAAAGTAEEAPGVELTDAEVTEAVEAAE